MSMTALVVDDHAGFRTSARFLLEMEGFEVVGEAVDAASALAAAERLRPELCCSTCSCRTARGTTWRARSSTAASAPADRPGLEPGRVRLRRQHPHVRGRRLRPEGRAVGRPAARPPGRGPVDAADATRALRRLATLAFAVCCCILAVVAVGSRRVAMVATAATPATSSSLVIIFTLPGGGRPDRPTTAPQRRRLGDARRRARRVLPDAVRTPTSGCSCDRVDCRWPTSQQR